MEGAEQWNTKLSYRFNKTTDQSLNKLHSNNEFQT